MLDIENASLYKKSPGTGPVQAQSLYKFPRHLQKAMRLDNEDLGRSLSRLWGSRKIIEKWEFQFIEAMRHVFSELRISAPRSTVSHVSTLSTFELDYSEARTLPPSPAARAVMGDLFHHIWPLHSSVVNGEDPVTHDLGLYDYTVLRVMQGTSLHPLHRGPLTSTKNRQQTLDSYDYGTAPVLTSAVKHG